MATPAMYASFFLDYWAKDKKSTVTTDLGLECLYTGLPTCVCSLEGGGGKWESEGGMARGKGEGEGGLLGVFVRARVCMCIYGWVGRWVGK